MNFIKLLGFWFVLIIVFSLLRPLPTNEDLSTFFLVMQIIMSCVFIITIVVLFFYQMDWKEGLKRRIRELKMEKKKLTFKSERYEELKPFFLKHLVEDFPNLEKEIFNKISESQPSELVALMQNYPDLKSSAVIKKFVDNVSELSKGILDQKVEIEIKRESVQQVLDNDWFFCPKKYKKLDLETI